MFKSNVNDVSDDLLREKFGLKDRDGWKLSTARDKFRQERNWYEKFRSYSYRPFDYRWVYHSNILMDRPRGELLKHISSSNIAIATTLQLSSPPFNHAFVTDMLPDNQLLSVKTKDRAYFFPLYSIEKGYKKLNINQQIVQKIEELIKKEIDPLMIMCYIYAILNSRIYRTTYESSLSLQFPRIPFTNRKEYFIKLAEYGRELINLHLLREFPFETITTYPVSGSNYVKIVYYNQRQKENLHK